MILERITVGSYMANCYIVGDSDTGEVVIIDPGDDADKIIDAVNAGGYAVKYITYTHSHFDHVGALNEIKGKYNAPVIRDVTDFTVGKYKIEVIKTPGHTSDGVCFKCENYLFSGDTLFHLSVGRTDLPTGNFEELKKSIKQLYLLPEDTIVLPGHGFKTTIGKEKHENPYIT
ncbi:MAG: putative metallo-hydrolase [Firmicutes bacterium ADurb.Bin193]|nr:MAG: putative metallo-hydrolase [Firmicutes bacterium ADurb.Bin193]